MSSKTLAAVGTERGDLEVEAPQGNTFVTESSLFFATFCETLSVTGVTEPGARNSHADFSNV
jgi:hypothetical protein